MNTEGILGYALGHYLLISQHDVDQHRFQAGDVFDMRIGGKWQTVRMESGGYTGWYFVTADGERVRPALCMKGRLADAELEGHTSFSEVK